MLSLLPFLGRPASPLQAQIAALENQRRSHHAFREWRPGIFFYLFAMVGAFWVPKVACPACSSLPSRAIMGLGFGLLCLLPGLVNGFCFWLLVRWPNRLLDRRIAPLQVQLKHRAEIAPPADLPPTPQPSHAEPAGLIPLPEPAPLASHPAPVAGSR